MKESKRQILEVRDRLSPNMIELYDIAMKAFSKRHKMPEFQGVLEENGTVIALKINNIPQAVMSDIFDGFTRVKERAGCGYGLIANITSEMDNFDFSLEITKDRTSE